MRRAYCWVTGACPARRNSFRHFGGRFTPLTIQESTAAQSPGPQRPVTARARNKRRKSHRRRYITVLRRSVLPVTQAPVAPRSTGRWLSTAKACRRGNCYATAHAGGSNAGAASTPKFEGIYLAIRDRIPTLRFMGRDGRLLSHHFRPGSLGERRVDLLAGGSDSGHFRGTGE